MTADQGYTFAFARSLALAQAAGHEGNWFAPGYSVDTGFYNMPNPGQCACGGKYMVSDVYHYSAISDDTWHTRYECKPLVLT